MLLFPPAKINLGLLIYGKRPDGYHEIESCMVRIPLEDVVEIHLSEAFHFKQTGLAVEGKLDDNLCVRAYKLMKEQYDIGPVSIHLRKNIPMGAGLGGGSADATYVLIGLNELFNLNLSDDDLRDLAAKLGSDCPFFVGDQPQIAKGRGEELHEISLDLSGYYVKLINPGIHIGTAEAYANVHFSEESYSLDSILKGDIHQWKKDLRNDFESSIFTEYPEIAEIKTKLYEEGAIYASMSGSGSSVFGLFSSKPEATFPNYFERILKLP